MAFELGWPFFGAAIMLRDTLTGVRQSAPTHGIDAAIRCYALGSAGWLLGFYAVVAVTSTCRAASGGLSSTGGRLAAANWTVVSAYC
jgi:hypothetical protein